jgi:hypothetical protein
MFHPRLSLVVILLGTGIGTLAQEAPMLYYPLEEGRGRVAADASGSVVQESDDQGAMELFGNPTYRGVVFRYNRFDNCGKTGTVGGRQDSRSMQQERLTRRQNGSKLIAPTAVR